MAISRDLRWHLVLGIVLALESVWCIPAKLTRFRLSTGHRVASDLQQLAFYSLPEMNSLSCAAFCTGNRECGYFQFSTVHGSCYTFKEQFSLAPFGDLVPDPEWTAGSLWNGPLWRGFWSLVYRAQSRVNIPAYTTWMSASQQDDNPLKDDFPEACLRFTDYGQCDRHFRSHTLDNWGKIPKVRFSLVKDEIEVAYILFNGTGSTMHNWFKETRVLNSTWAPAILTDDNLYGYSLNGLCDQWTCRRFRIHKIYGPCWTSSFFTFTIDKPYDLCNDGSWKPQNLTSIPIFYYTTGPGQGSIGTGQVTKGYYKGDEADVMSVWVKFA
ncbi:hypothetical protein RRG08_045241 [Elysia crispata]|uniref:Apple domain-containing protein n=1 Tax=Elysia crispata TaxID=231223 RepID=A0AAE1A1H1_9GAST|nr:hypothetical protein RRG08_045241 [Elysia crispata]